MVNGSAFPIACIRVYHSLSSAGKAVAGLQRWAAFLYHAGSTIWRTCQHGFFPVGYANLSGGLVIASRFLYDSPLRRVDVPFLEVFTSGASQASNKHD